MKNSGSKGFYASCIKRIIDFLIALAVLLLFWWLLLIIAAAVRIDSKGPAFFKQERIGRNGKTFTLYKFRSMCVDAEHTGSGVYSEKGDPRVTKVGNILRKTSLDELPQLYNILRGDMALIGPRPPLTYHPWPISEYSPEQKRMFDVRPGITGWAQINGRKCVEWHKRIEMNVWYVDHVSFILDLKIFFYTIVAVLKCSDNENSGKTVKK